MVVKKVGKFDKGTLVVTPKQGQVSDAVQSTGGEPKVILPDKPDLWLAASGCRESVWG